MIGWMSYTSLPSFVNKFSKFTKLLQNVRLYAPFKEWFGPTGEQLVRKEVFLVVARSIVKFSQISKQWFYSRVSRVVEYTRSKFISELFKSKLNLDSSDEKWMLLKQNSDVLLPMYIGTINFAFYFLKQIQKADRGATVFGSWVDVISNSRPDSLKLCRATLQGRLWEGIAGIHTVRA